jgi:major membrane immunogen (membrane-anchored lipoprotein)
MKIKTLLLSVLTLAMLLTGCTTKDETVTPVVDNGYYLVVYRVSNSGGSSINVDIEGKGVGSITSVNAIAPDCTPKANGYIKYEVSPGTYYVKAIGTNGQAWESTVKITQTGCFFLKIP